MLGLLSSITRPSPVEQAVRGAEHLPHHDLPRAVGVHDVGLGPAAAPTTWPITTLAEPLGSMQLGWALVRMLCGRIRAGRSSAAWNVSSSVMPSIVSSDQVWSKMKLPHAYQMGLPSWTS